MEVTRDKFERQALVVLVDDEGNVEWSSHRSRDEVVEMLQNIAAGISAGEL